MFRSQEIILREYACTLLKSLNNLKVFKGFFKFKTLNLKSRCLTLRCGSNTVINLKCVKVYISIENYTNTFMYFKEINTLN